RINPRLRVTGVILCMCEANTKLAQEVVHDLDEFLASSRNSNVPWNQAHVFAARIRRNIKLAEAPSFGKSIFGYAPTCNGAEDYLALAMEVAGEPMPKVVSAKVKIPVAEPVA
ncbi:MAG TPA: ParA family protein, partial [Gemmataceae bacterium]|nr:ParA family protein [Gemmataceae bacterium]